ncbi:hypothetical protein [Stenotrophomonas rhizophila]|uniref:hypothetical protein n=1 Tax=Stenotrophomonas rhizophila TaxID=216778 RepID=UPI0028AEB218|nr:hypothetical protein [Stenotrophomonas rhizophila]
MRLAATVPLLLASGAVQALTLTCDINTPSTYEQGTVAVIFNVDEETGDVRFHTLSEAVAGRLQVGQSEFRGIVTGTTGQRYWLSIDRYLGTMALTRENHISGQKAVMWGDCRAAKQKF